MFRVQECVRINSCRDLWMFAPLCVVVLRYPEKERLWQLRVACIPAERRQPTVSSLCFQCISAGDMPSLQWAAVWALGTSEMCIPSPSLIVRHTDDVTLMDQRRVTRLQMNAH